MWLNDHGVDITCIRLQPYKDEEGALLLDIQQIIPLPEAADYQTQIKAKEQAGKAHQAERFDLRYQFWSELLRLAKTKTGLHSDPMVNPGTSSRRLLEKILIGRTFLTDERDQKGY
jgi:hypothetical protein